MFRGRQNKPLQHLLFFGLLFPFLLHHDYPGNLISIPYLGAIENNVSICSCVRGALGNFHERFLRLAVVLIDVRIPGRVRDCPCILEAESYNQIVR